jgi:hypothetical protein
LPPPHTFRRRLGTAGPDASGDPFAQHVLKYPDSLLTRFYGMHRVKPHKKLEKHFLIIGNIFCTKKTIHITFDLKASRSSACSSGL